MTILSSRMPPLPPRRARWQDALGLLGPLVGLVLVYALFALLRPNTFATGENAQVMLLQTAVVGTAALGMTLIIIAGGIDLSVGANIALCTVAIAVLLRPWDIPLKERLLAGAAGFPPVVAALGGAATGAACGLLIGALVIGHIGRVAAVLAGGAVGVWLHQSGVSLWIAVPVGIVVASAIWVASTIALSRVELVPFIVTLGMWGALRGVAKRLGNDQPVYPPYLETNWLFNLLTRPAAKDWWLLLPVGVWLMLILAVAVAVMLRYTRLGRHIVAIGSNELTARLCGIRVEGVKLIVYAMGGAFAGLAGVLQFSRLRMGDPTTADGMELNIIAAVVIGGASLSGGQGSVLGSLVGALIMTIVSNGCAKMGYSTSVQQIVTGGIIIVAVALDQLRRRRQQA